MKHLLVIMIIVSGLCLPARAEIPLVLEATFQVPSAWRYNIQHWADDTTFGWVAISGHTASYCMRLGDSVRTCVFSTPFPSGLFATYRSPEYPSDACIVAAANLGYYPDDLNYLNTYDLTTCQTLASITLGQCFVDDEGMHWASQCVNVGALFPWPPLPDTTRMLVDARTYTSQSCFDGGGPAYCRSQGYGLVYFSTPDELNNISVVGGNSVSAFPYSNPVRFAYGGEQFFHSDYEGETSYDSCWVNTILPGHSVGIRDDSSGCFTALAQQDADGTERIIVSGTWPTRALDPDDYSVLWQNSSIRGTLNTGQIGGSGDERLLAYDSGSHRFQVYDASDGTFLDSTTAVAGDAQYLIKRTFHVSEIVTYGAANTVRIYKSLQPDPAGLTCQFIPESSLIRLNWPATGAIQYYVYSGGRPGEAEVLEAIVPAGTHSLDLTPDASRWFYFVTAEYGAR